MSRKMSEFGIGSDSVGIACRLVCCFRRCLRHDLAEISHRHIEVRGFWRRALAGLRQPGAQATTQQQARCTAAKSMKKVNVALYRDHAHSQAKDVGLSPWFGIAWSSSCKGVCHIVPFEAHPKLNPKPCKF